jgi:outer membrane protein TolC
VAPGDAFGFPDYLTNFFLDLSENTGVLLDAPNIDPNAISEFQFGTPQSATFGITATQLIFSGSYIVGIQAAKVYEEARRVTTSKTIVEVTQSVSSAYYTALAALENETNLRKASVLMEETAKETQALAEAGFLEQLDVDMADLASRTLDNQLENATLQKKLTYSLLLYQIGLPVDTDISLSDNMTSLIEQSTLTPSIITDLDVSKVPAVVEQQYFYELAEWNVKETKARSLPQISGFYTNSQNAQRDVFNIFDSSGKWYPTQLWGVQVSMPVFGSFEGKHIRQKAQVQALKAETGLQMTLQATQLEQSAASAELRRSRDMVDEAINSLSLATKIFDNVKLGHSEGVKSSFELNQVHNQLLTNAGALVGARLRLLNAHSRFIAATTTNK